MSRSARGIWAHHRALTLTYRPIPTPGRTQFAQDDGNTARADRAAKNVTNLDPFRCQEVHYGGEDAMLPIALIVAPSTGVIMIGLRLFGAGSLASSPVGGLHSESLFVDDCRALAATVRTDLSTLDDCTIRKETTMLEPLKNLPPGISGLKAVGTLTRNDYETVLEPLLEDARREGRHLRFLYELGPEFEGVTPGAAWEDAKVGLRSLSLFEGCAIVSDADWISRVTRFAGFLMPCPVRVFPTSERAEAVRWLQSLPEAGASHRLLPELGVIVVEVTGALRAHDFDSLALTADSWIEAHGDLQGVVIHAREFPGWENLGGLLRHLRFVRDHHRKVKRIALASEGKLFKLAPRLGEHFVEAKVKTFGYEELDGAIAWAGTKEAPSSVAHERSPGRET